jgi:predicted esterase
MQEHRLSVARTARYYTLGALGPATRQVWFVCHGYGQLAGRFLRHFAPLDDGSRLIVAPEGLSRFYLSERAAERRVGASWMTREDRVAEIDDYVRYLDAVHAAVAGSGDRSPAPLHALGFSQGAATVSRWAAFGAAPIDRLVLWGGEFPPDLDLSLATVAGRLRATRLSLVYGRADQFMTPKVIGTITERLQAHGVPYRDVAFAGGHELNETVLRDLAAP